MKFFGVMFAYLFIGLILGLGILGVTHGHLWFFVVGVLVYLAAFAKIGCLPSGKAH